ncbi:hypothetical protein D3C78_1537540 [compost metagenome]
MGAFIVRQGDGSHPSPQAGSARVMHRTAMKTAAAVDQAALLTCRRRREATAAGASSRARASQSMSGLAACEAATMARSSAAEATLAITEATPGRLRA